MCMAIALPRVPDSCCRITWMLARPRAQPVVMVSYMVPPIM